MERTWAGWSNYRYAFLSDPIYIRTWVESLQNMAYEVPIIVIYSLFIAVLLNQKFRGRTLARAIFFLPVIVASGIIMTIFRNDVFASSIRIGNAQAAYIFQSTGLQELLLEAGVHYRIVQYFTEIINRIFDLTWKSGVQILLFLAGLQTIPASLYEASDVEGCTAWEGFWKITFPMISPIILVNVVYSVIDAFTDYSNTIMQMIYNVGYVQLRYAYSATIAWLYFISIFLIIGLVNFILSKKIFYMVD